MIMIDRLEGKLFVTPDNTTPGSEGRLYLQLPERMELYVGQRLRCVGSFGAHGAVMFIVSGAGITVTPRRQLWWKNGVRDHNVRENWNITLYLLEQNIFVAVMSSKTGEKAPDLPPHQETFFE